MKIFDKPKIEPNTMENIMGSYDRISRRDGRRQLRQLADMIYPRSPLLEILFTHEKGSDFNAFCPRNFFKKDRMQINIGLGYAEQDCKLSEFSAAGYVYSVFMMYHERSHFNQRVFEWQKTEQEAYLERSPNCDSVSVDNLIRRKFISTYFYSAYTHNYNNDPSEISANYDALKDSLCYFRTDKDPFVKGIVAGDILFHIMTSDDLGHVSHFLNENVKTVDDIVQDFCDRRVSAAEKPYILSDMMWPIDYDLTKSENDLTDDLIRNNHSVYYAVNQFHNGIAQDRLLEQYIFSKYPETVMCCPRLQSEFQYYGASVKNGVWILSEEELLSGVPDLTLALAGLTGKSMADPNLI